MTVFELNDEGSNLTDPLLPEGKKAKKVTPLPKLQIGILLFFQLAEPITSQCIYPFINQVASPLPLEMSLLTTSRSLLASLTLPEETRERLGIMLVS